MKYFHCPNTYRRKQYGCGFGPVNATQAFLDLGNRCPKCGQTLKPHRVKKAQKAHKQAEQDKAIQFVKETFGEEAAKRYSQKFKIKE